MNCEECKHDNQNVVISKYAYEREQTQHETSHKRMFRLIIAILVGWMLTIGAFVWYLYQYDFVGESYEYSQDGEGVNIIGDKNGVDYYGAESGSSETLSNPQEQERR